MMTALNNELKISQGTVNDLKSSIGDVSLKIEQTTNYSKIFLQLVSQNQALMEKHYGLQDKQLEVQVSYLCIVWVWDYEQYKSDW